MRYFLHGFMALLACCVFLLSASPAGAATTNWNMLGYSSSHKRVNPYETVLSKSNVAHLTLDWTVSTGGVIESLDTIVSNGIAYFTSQDGKLYAVNASTGALLWSESLNPSEYFGGLAYSSPAVANGILYVEVEKNSSPYTSLYALNAKTGKVLWSVDGPGPFSSPTIVHGVVYVGGDFNTFYAINAVSGKVLWSDILNTVPNYITHSPAVVNGSVYVAIDGASTSSMFALNSSTGATLWTTPLGADVSNSSPAVSDGFVFIGAGDGLMYALNASTGKVKWTSQNIGNIIASPAVFHKLVYIGGNGLNNHKLFAFNENSGSLVWTANTGGNTLASATIANGIVYFASADGSAYAFDALTSTTLWTGTAGSCPSDNNCTLSSPVVSNGILYIGGSDGKMYAFHLAS